MGLDYGVAVLASSRAGSLPQWFCGHCSIVGASLLAMGTKQATKKAPTQPTADRGRNGLGEGFLYDCFIAR